MNKKMDWQSYYTDAQGEHVGMLFKDCTQHEARLHAAGYYDPPFRIEVVGNPAVGQVVFTGMDLATKDGDRGCTVKGHLEDGHVHIDSVKHSGPGVFQGGEARLPVKSSRKYRIYVAGKLNGDACGYVRNMGLMIEEAGALMANGFAVHVPALDVIMGIRFKMGYEDYFQNNSAWVLGSDAVYLCPGYEKSEGVKREIRLANENGLPVFDNVFDLIAWRNRQ